LQRHYQPMDGLVMSIDVPWILHDGVTSRLDVDLPIQCEKVFSPPSSYYSQQGNDEDRELQWSPTFAYFVLQVSTGEKISPTRTSNLRRLIRFKRDMENRYYRKNDNRRASTTSYYDGSMLATPPSMMLGGCPSMILPRRHCAFEGSAPIGKLPGDSFSVFDETESH